MIAFLDEKLNKETVKEKVNKLNGTS